MEFIFGRYLSLLIELEILYKLNILFFTFYLPFIFFSLFHQINICFYIIFTWYWTWWILRSSLSLIRIIKRFFLSKKFTLDWPTFFVVWRDWWIFSSKWSCIFVQVFLIFLLKKFSFKLSLNYLFIEICHRLWWILCLMPLNFLFNLSKIRIIFNIVL